MKLKSALAALALALCALMPAAANTTVPDSYFGVEFNRPFPGGMPSYPPFRLAFTRFWFTQWTGGVNTNWINVEPSQNVYSFTNLDAQVAWAASHGLRIFYQFGNPGAWANGTGNQNDPITNAQFFCDAANVYTLRYNGQNGHGEIDDWSSGNEINFLNTPVGSLQAQMAQCLYTYAHANNPNAVVHSPNVTDTTRSGLAAYAAFIAAGGDTYTDARDVHNYLEQNGISHYPADQAFFSLDFYNDLYLDTGVSTSKPMYVTEAGNKLDHNFPPYIAAANTAIQLIAPASKGVAGQNTYIWDTLSLASNSVIPLMETCPPVTYVTGGSTSNCPTPTVQFGQGLSLTGTVYMNVSRWLHGLTFTSPMTRQFTFATDNLITNHEATGAVAGIVGGTTQCVPNTGTMPTDTTLQGTWIATNADCINGIEMDVATGTDPDTGFNDIDIRVHGTWTGPGPTFTGTGSGTNLTVTGTTGGTIVIGNQIIAAVSGASVGVPGGTFILSQTSGPLGCSPVGSGGCTAGGDGVYVTSKSTTASSAALTTVSKGFVTITPTGIGTSAPAARFGQFLYTCAYQKLVAGSWNGIVSSQLKHTQYNASQVALGDAAVSQFTWLPTVSLAHGNFCAGGGLTGDGAANDTSVYAISYSAGVPIDITIRYAHVDLDAKSVWVGNCTKPGGIVCQIWWDEGGMPNGGCTMQTVSSTYLYWEDALGNHGTIQNHQISTCGGIPVAITNIPMPGYVPAFSSNVRPLLIAANDNRRPAMLRRSAF